MGTTVVASVVTDDVITIGSAGDSRCYLLRGGELRQLTTDDSWVSAAWAEGVLSSDEIDKHPLRNVITKAIGAKETLDWTSTSSSTSSRTATSSWAARTVSTACSRTIRFSVS